MLYIYVYININVYIYIYTYMCVYTDMCLSQLGFSMMQPKPKKVTPSTIDGQDSPVFVVNGGCPSAAQVRLPKLVTPRTIVVQVWELQRRTCRLHTLRCLTLHYMTLRDTRLEYIYI